MLHQKETKIEREEKIKINIRKFDPSLSCGLTLPWSSLESAETVWGAWHIVSSGTLSNHVQKRL